MECTFHATIRARQRGINSEVLQLVIRFGAELPAPHGARSYMLDRKGMAKAADYLRTSGKVQTVDQLKGIVVIMKGHFIVTAYHSGRRRYR